METEYLQMKNLFFFLYISANAYFLRIPKLRSPLKLKSSFPEYAEKAKLFLGDCNTSIDVIQNVAFGLREKDFETQNQLREKDHENQLKKKDNYYLRKLSILSQRYS